MWKLRAYHIKSLKIDRGTTIYIHYLQRIFEKKWYWISIGYKIYSMIKWNYIGKNWIMMDISEVYVTLKTTA